MLLSCKACDAPLKADDINMEHGIASCRYCNAVMRFAELAGGGEPEVALNEKRAPVPMPSGMTVEEYGGRLRIVRRWLTPVAFFLVFFCIAWNAFLVFWYSMAFGDANTPWIMKVFPIGHIAVGVGLSYYTLTCFLNRTVIAVEAGELVIRHGPLPWPGNASIDTTHIEQLYCQEKTHRGENSTHTTYSVFAVDRDGQTRKLLSNLSARDQALYIEQRLEEELNLEDRPVGGEIPR